MKILTTILWGAFLITGVSQEAPKTDPFKKKSDRPITSDAKARQQVLLSVEFIDVAKADHANWKLEKLTGNNFRAKVEETIKKGEAQVVESTVFIAKSSQRAKSASSRDVVSPSEWQTLSFDAHGPLFPVSQEQSEHCGFVTEVDPVIIDNGRKIKLSIAIERKKYIDEDRTLYPNGDRLHPTDTIRPRFSAQRITTGMETIPGEYQMVSSHPSLKKADDRLTLVFLLTDIQDVFPSTTELANPENIKLRCEWIEVPADQWHRFAYSKHLKDLPVESWAWASDLLGKGEATSICDHRFATPNGNRSKNETIVYSSVTKKFSPPTVLGGNCNPKETDRLTSGFTTEIDPIYTASGNLIELNMAPTYSYRGEDFVCYRKLVEDKWIPAVTAANVHTARLTTQIFVPTKGSILSGALSPCDPAGVQDPTRKHLVFWHNETYK